MCFELSLKVFSTGLQEIFVASHRFFVWQSTKQAENIMAKKVIKTKYFCRAQTETQRLTRDSEHREGFALKEIRRILRCTRFVSSLGKADSVNSIYNKVSISDTLWLCVSV